MQLLSVIVPVYNVEKFINDCIDSILGQSYKNIELILVDDGSTDSSGEICDKYCSVDKRVWLNRITIRKRGPFRSSLFIFRILGCAGISL